MRKIYILALLAAMSCGIATADTQHKVQAGETLQSIASRYGVTVDAIKAVNPKAAKYVYAGMMLSIPDATAAPAQTVSADTPASAPAKAIVAADQPAKSAVAADQPTAAISADQPAAIPNQADIAAQQAAMQAAILADVPASARPLIEATMNAAANPATAAPGGPCPADQRVRSSAKNNSVNLEWGSLDAFRQQGALAKVTVDYSQCLVEGKKSVDQWLADKGGNWTQDWPKESSNSHNFICTMYNFRNKDVMQLSCTAGNYQIVIRPEWIDFGDVGSQFNPFASAKAGGCIMRGTLTLYDPQGNPLCQLWLNDIKGLGEFNFEARLRAMYSELGTRLKKVVKK